ncbi:MAG: lipid droplet-associated protein [Mycobacteriaceae bacterium]
MIRPPFAVRLLAGIAVTAIEETRKLPTTAVTLPMTAISQTLQNAMRLQQSITTLAIKGDEALTELFAKAEEQPEWATFDEDENNNEEQQTLDHPGVHPEPEETSASSPGKYALYSTPPPAPQSANTEAKKAEAAPEIAEYLDYSNLTLAQLRARLRSLSVEELEELLDFEERTHARAPFQTMLANRITSAGTK